MFGLVGVLWTIQVSRHDTYVVSYSVREVDVSHVSVHSPYSDIRLLTFCLIPWRFITIT